MTRVSTSRALAIAAALALGIGAAAAPAAAQPQRVEQTDRSTETLAIGAAGSLELKTISGDITVSAGTGPNVTVDILRRSRADTAANARLGLDRVHPTVDRGADRATVSVVYPRMSGHVPYTISVSYIVSAPPDTRITAGTISGSISITAIRGDVSAELVAGNLTIRGARRISTARTISGSVTIQDATSDATIAAGTVSGSVELDRVRARRIEADAVSGDVIVHDAACESAAVKSLSGTVDYTGTLAAGGRHEATSHSGNVHFAASGSAGFELQATTFSGGITTDPKLALRGASLTRRSVRGTVGDGSASVVLTTFSGNVSVERR